MEEFVWQKVAIPKGISNLLGFISKETIVHKPDCVYTFIAELLEQEIRERNTKGESNERTEETHLLAATEENEGDKLSEFNGQRNFSVDDQPQPSTQLSQVDVINEDLDKNSQDSPIQNVVLPTTTTPEIGEDKQDDLIENFKSPPLSISPVSTPPQPDLQSSPSASISPVLEVRAESQYEKIISGSTSPSEGHAPSSRPESQNLSKLTTITPPLTTNEDEQNNENFSDIEQDELDLEQQLNTKELSDLLASGDFSSVSRSEEQHDEDEDADEEEEEEEVKGDDSSHEELRVAATRIQAGFRGYQTRKHLKNKKESEVTSDETDNTVSPLRRPPSSGGGVTRRQGSGKTRNSSKYRSGMVFLDNSPVPENLSLDGQYLDQAATRIQANVRGFLTRRNIES